MADERSSIEARLDRMAEDMQRLGDRVDGLTRQLRHVAAGAGVSLHDSAQATAPHARGLHAPASTSTATLLGGLATVCFLLVIALSLRTLTDNRLVAQGLGAALGLGYAALIIVFGYFRSARNKRFGAVYVVCGAVLILAIVLELHLSFKLLPAAWGYLILSLLLVTATIGGLRFGACSTINVAVPGAAVAAMALDFPEPHFPALAGVLLLATGAAWLTTRRDCTRWLLWALSGLNLLFWIWYGLKTRQYLLHQTGSANNPVEYMVILIAFAALYTFLFFNAAHRATWPFGAFEFILPLGLLSTGYGAARVVMLPLRQETILGIAGAVTAFACLLVAAAMGARAAKGPLVSASLVLAGLLLLALSLPQATTPPALTVLLWAVAAYTVSRLSTGRLDGRLHVAALALSTYTCGAALYWKLPSVAPDGVFLRTLALVLLVAVSVAHVRTLSRDAMRDADDAPPDVAAVPVILACALYAFGVGRIGLHALLGALSFDSLAAFQCAQSMLINVMGLILGILGLKTRSAALLGVAVAVALVGAAKVFVYDLTQTQGIPLLLSIFTFGLTTAAGSFLWTRWQRQSSPDEQEASETS